MKYTYMLLNVTQMFIFTKNNNKFNYIKIKNFHHEKTQQRVKR